MQPRILLVTQGIQNKPTTYQDTDLTFRPTFKLTGTCTTINKTFVIYAAICYHHILTDRQGIQNNLLFHYKRYTLINNTFIAVLFRDDLLSSAIHLELIHNL